MGYIGDIVDVELVWNSEGLDIKAKQCKKQYLSTDTSIAG
jgi:hypothetical protein